METRRYVKLWIATLVLGMSGLVARGAGEPERFIDHFLMLAGAAAPAGSEDDQFLTAFKAEWTADRFCPEDTVAFQGLVRMMEAKGLAQHPDCFVAMAKAFEVRHATSVVVGFPFQAFYDNACFVIAELQPQAVAAYFQTLQDLIATGKVNGFDVGGR